MLCLPQLLPPLHWIYVLTSKFLHSLPIGSGAVLASASCPEVAEHRGEGVGLQRRHGVRLLLLH
ncbi:hypothetical protein LINPERPRIM_LOCUS39845 [Linum perenne]